MYIKKISYEDFDGNKQVEDFYFNLTDTEINRINAQYVGGLPYYINKIIRSGNTQQILPVLENLVLSAYGEKTMDGRRFIKSDLLKEEFKQTMAYDTLIRELMSDPTGKVFSDFLINTLPKDTAAKLNYELSKDNKFVE